MAEIEFKRRGTPLWVVVLALIVIALVVWFFVRQRAGAPTAAAPATQPAPTTAPPASATPSGTPAPAAAPALAPVDRYSAFVDSTPAATEAGAAPYVAEGLSRLADAMQQQFPTSGVQVNLVRAMSDSLRLPGIPARRQADMAQAAFFAAIFAMKQSDSAGALSNAAAQVRLDRTLQQQLPVVRDVFRAARTAVKRGPAAPAAQPPAGAPKG